MNRKRTKFILLLIGTSMLLVISLILAISHINYAVSYEDWYSYMTLENAIIVSVVCMIIAFLSLFIIVYSIVKIVKANKTKKEA